MTSSFTVEVREGHTVAGSDYTIKGTPVWRARTYVGGHIVDQNESRISADDARAKSQRRIDARGADWLRIYG